MFRHILNATDDYEVHKNTDSSIYITEIQPAIAFSKATEDFTMAAHNVRAFQHVPYPTEANE